MCRVQDPGLYLKGEGHNHWSKVKKRDILLCPDYNSIPRVCIFYIMWHTCSSKEGVLSHTEPRSIAHRSRSQLQVNVEIAVSRIYLGTFVTYCEPILVFKYILT